MDDLDAILPVYVDYLGCFEQGQDSIETPPDVMRELHERGAQENRFLPYGELAVEDDQLVLRDSPDRIVAERFDLKLIEEPVAFVKRTQDANDGFTRVVVFSEKKSGHFKSKAQFHAFQCCDSDPIELVEMIKAGQTLARMPRLAQKQRHKKISRQDSNRSKNSLDSNWILAGNAHVSRNTTGTDSVRSATIRRSGVSSRASLPFGPFASNQTNNNNHSHIANGNGKQYPPYPPSPTSAAAAIPVNPPAPPPEYKSKVEKKPSVPLVTAQTAETLGFDRPSFQYGISEDPKQKDTILLNYCIDDIERFCAEIKANQASDSSELAGVSKGREFRAIDFVNIFQKFKCAFNLLGRLEGYIDNPSAPEMLHHLFPPLAFLVDECYDLFDEDLVRDVVAPLPTQKSVEFLDRCLGQREAVIWRALGENWLNPKVRKSSDVTPYQPRFQDGWSPGAIHFTDEHQNLAKKKSSDSSGHKRKGSNISDISNLTYSSDNDNVFKRSSGASYNGSIISTFDDFRDELMEAGAKMALVTHSRDGQNVKELTIVKGEYLEIVDDTKNWWRVINSTGQAGFVPRTILKVVIYEDAENYVKNVSRSSSKKTSAPRKRTPPKYQESSDSDTTEIIQPTTVVKKMSSTQKQNQVISAPTQAPTPPPAPPMPLIQPPTPIIARNRRDMPRNNSIASVRSGQSMQEELKSVLDLFRQDDPDDKIKIKTTPDVYITHKSTPKEIRQWLKAKDFSQRAQDQLSKLDGTKLFAMQRKDLIAAFGKVEGIRLDSQITISRNSAGYQTAKTSELRQILAKARRRSEKEREAFEPDLTNDDNDNEESD